MRSGASQVARAGAAAGLLSSVLVAVAPGHPPLRDLFAPVGWTAALVTGALSAAILLVSRPSREARLAAQAIGGILFSAIVFHVLTGWPPLPGPYQYLTAVAALGGALAVYPLRSRFMDPADLLNECAAAVVLLAIGAWAVGFWPYFADTAKASVGTGTLIALLGICIGLGASRVSTGVACVLSSNTPAGYTARVLLPIPFIFPFIFSFLNLAALGRKWYEPHLGIWLFALANTLIFAILVSWAVILLHRAQEALQTANETLESRVRERTMELTREMAQREAAMEKLARSNAELEQFAWVASHDLQEPLRTVTSYAQLIGRRYRDRLDSDGLEFLSYLEQGARRMHLLVSDLLDYSRVVHDELEITDVDLEDLLSAVLADLGTLISETDASIRHDPLPRVRGSAAQLRQVFLNLVGNALKYRSPERSPVVRISCTAHPKEWLFSVTDNGIGIDPRYRERIFGLFKRLHREAYPGTGVGLALCRRVVQAHSGRIWADGNPDGPGSAFWFTIAR